MTPKEHNRITRELENNIKKLRHESQSDQLTLAQKLSILAKHKSKQETLWEHKLNYFELVAS